MGWSVHTKGVALFRVYRFKVYPSWDGLLFRNRCTLINRYFEAQQFSLNFAWNMKCGTESTNALCSRSVSFFPLGDVNSLGYVLIEMKMNDRSCLYVAVSFKDLYLGNSEKKWHKLSKNITMNVTVTFSSASNDLKPPFCITISRHPEFDGQFRHFSLPSKESLSASILTFISNDEWLGWKNLTKMVYRPENGTFDLNWTVAFSGPK